MDTIRDYLKIKVLPKELIIKNCIKNYNYCNYELYLTDLLRKADCFQSFENGKLEYNSYQSKHECDAYANEYGLDYKLLGTRSALQAINESSPQQEITTNGVCVMKVAKGRKDQTATWLFSICNSTSFEELVAISKNTSITKANTKGYDLLHVLNSVDVDKNIFVLSTEYFVLLSEFAYEDVVNEILTIVNKAFASVFKYRDIHNKEFESYLGIIYGGYLLIFQWISEKFILLGKQKLYESELFRKSCQFVYPNEMYNMGIIQLEQSKVNNEQTNYKI